MKVLLVVALVASLFAVPLEAQADHKPNFYCSKTGDICQSVQKVDNVRKLRIATAAKYFGRFKLCVTAPDDSKKCKEFRIFKEGPIWARSVRWSRHFPKKGGGAYTVRWKPTSGDGQYGHALGFHR